ncbi:MAG: acyl dehydratase [Nocardioidaceae bacterium]|nr:acyl dehydratase [Nocardioidaceae bacterium]
MTGRDGPYFEDIEVGAVVSAPGQTIDAGSRAVHRAILGDRLALAADDALAERVTGRPGLAHPGLVWDIAIGQSSVLTRQVVANLFYRDLRFHATASAGDTLTTTTEVLATTRARARADRPPRGKVLLRMTTRDQAGRVVLTLDRCALVRCRDGSPAAAPAAAAGEAFVAPAGLRPLTTPTWLDGWDLEPLRQGEPTPVTVGYRAELSYGDVVSSAPELARLTGNVAAVHHDASAGGGRRLVYGGHAIGLALGQVCRLVPGLVTVTEWFACDHVGPVHEDDTLTTRVSVLGTEDYRDGAVLAVLHAETWAAGRRPVLDWTFVGVVA